MIYKVSYVITGRKHAGAIANQLEPPQIGSQVQVGDLYCQVVEIKELLPPQAGFAYLHVTCQAIEPAAGDSE